MKKRPMGPILLAVFLSASANSAAAYETGNSLLANCNAPSLSEHWYCLGYVVSASDTHALLTCPPTGVAKSDLKRVVVKYLEQNPEDLHKGAAGVVLNALVEAFPCDQ